MEKRFYLKAFMVFFGLFLLAVPLWVNKYFGAADFDQLLFTIKFGLRSTLSSDPIFIKRFIKWCLVGPFLLGSCLISLSIFTKRYMQSASSFTSSLPWQSFILIIGSAFFIHQFSVVHFILGQFKQSSKNDFYDSHYIDPRHLTFTSTSPKNLVLIYVESLEANYTNAQLFKHNLLEALQRYDHESLSFPSFRQLSGTGWTIAGLVATQCGIPLKSVTVFGNNRQGEVMDNFLSSAKCLSDILAEQGYQNIYMKGASLRFGGIRQFLKSHHYSEIYGKEEWQSHTDSSTNKGWGLHDDDLFALAKTRLKQLMASDQRFNLTLLTVDTHGYEGYLNSTCRRKGYQGFDGIVTCTGAELADFVDYIKENQWLDRLSVVIIGDHLAMKNPLSEDLERKTPRSIYNMLITQPRPVLRTTTLDHFDWLPTLLDLLGIKYPGDRIALGYSGIKHEAATAIPNNRFEILEDNMMQYSEFYNDLWNA